MEKTRKKVTLKKVLGWLHLWLGLAAGLVVVISMLGATVYVWADELRDWWYSDLIYHEASYDSPHLPPSRLFAAVKAAHPDKHAYAIRAVPDPDKNWNLLFYKRAENPGWTWASGIEYNMAVYVNPHTGNVVGHIDRKRDWISLMAVLHTNLLLESDIGTQIVSIAALIMIFLALSGLYLWWPKNIKVLRQRLTVKLKARFKRINWDVHSVGGFYTYLFMIFFAATGLVWSYTWWSDGIYRLLGSDPREVFQRPEAPVLTGADQAVAINIAFNDAIQRQPSWQRIKLDVPWPGYQKGMIRASVSFDHETSWWIARDAYYYHPETGQVIGTSTFDEKLLGEKWRESNYELHVGSIFGWPTKIIATICTLFFAILPISGFLIWWGRRNKKSGKHSGQKIRKLYQEYEN